MTTMQQLGSSEIDTKIAPHQFCERLCLVKTSPNTDFAFTPGRAGPDQTVTLNKLWPALKFNSFNELMDQLRMDIDDPKSIKWTRITAKFTVAANKLATKAGISMAKAGFAYLLGKGNHSANFLAILTKNDSGELVEDDVIFDFFDSVIEMEGAEGYCASSEFQHAFKIAMARMEIEESGDDVMPVQVTTMNSAKKTLVMGGQPAKDEEARKETPRRTSTRKKKQDVPVETVEFNGKEANASDTSSFGFGAFGAELAGEQDDDEEVDPAGKNRNNSTPDLGVTSNVKTALTPSKQNSVQSEIDLNASLQQAAKSNSIESTLEDTSPPSVEEMAVDEEVETGLQDPAHFDKKKVEYSLSKSQIHLPWAKLWKEMRSEGWRYTAGDSTVSIYYIHPRWAGVRKKEVLRGKKGSDYFESEDEVQIFAKEHLGWKGEKLLSTPGEMMMSSPLVITTATTNKRKKINASDRNASLSKKTRTDCQHSDVQKPTNLSTLSNKAPYPTNSKQSSKSSHAGESKESYIPLPDQQLSYKDKLEYCKLTLHPSYLAFQSSNSVFEQLENEIKLFMTRAIGTGNEIDGMAGQSPGFMYICGGPGTVVTACSQHLAKWAKDSGFAKPCYCHINMASNASMGIDAIKNEMFKSMAKKLGIKKNSSLAVFMNQFRKKGMILVVDEIAMLFKNQGGSAEEWFSTLIEWCEDKELPFSMIGISNSVNDINATKIRELSNTPHELVFPTCNEEDLLAILEKRVGKKIVDAKALQLIAERVAASTGDACKALEITSNAVDKALDACTEKWLDEVEADSYPLVKLPQMMRAIREGMPTRHEEIIRGLPQAAKVILCIAVSLGKVWGPTAAVSVATLKKYAVQATQHAMLDDASLGQMTTLLEVLMDSGLLTPTLDGCFNFNANDHSSLLHIGVQLDDVEIALEKSLLEESSFYRSLVDYTSLADARLAATRGFK